MLTPWLLDSIDKGYYSAIPIRRPLSSMTEEEKKEMDLFWAESIALHRQENNDSDDIMGQPIWHKTRMVMWYLRKGFDVFHWIEQGFAIRKEE